jgi:thiamine-phosphate pyrophosphorylase
VIEAGARRIVVVRAITEADDPPAAAARLRAMLDAVALESPR